MLRYWNDLFKNRDVEFLHEVELEENIEYLKNRKLVELGAGDGRNSLFLLKNGFDISAYDYSEEGIKKIIKKTKDRNLSINTKIVDIEKEKLYLGNFEGILFIHYFPKMEKAREIICGLEKNTIIFILTFIKEENESNKKTIGISYNEIQEIKSIGIVLKEKIIEDSRGKSYLLIMEII